jgi:hypothetical protein
VRRAAKWLRTGICRGVCGVVLLGFSLSGVALAQDSSSDVSDHETIKILLKRVSDLESELKEVKANQNGSIPAAAEPTLAAAVPAQASPASTGMDDMNMGPEHPSAFGLHGLQFRGFADVSGHATDLKGSTTSFALGSLDLFMTSQLNQQLNVVGELVFESDETNTIGVDLERFLLQYSPNDYFKLGVGRFHTAIGYYNTAYHHGTWLQTAVGRPFIFQFEDDDGILPIHNVGLTATGAIPSGDLGLHYTAEVGNGRTSHSPNAEAVQNIIDENNGKAVNFALFARPFAWPGFEAGFSVYHDNLTPTGSANIGEIISDVHVVYTKAPWEFLNEAILIHHAVSNGRTFDTPAFYTQIARQFGVLRPYFRYQYLNVSDAEPVFIGVERQNGPSLGVRYDFAESAAFKVQYDRTGRRDLPPINDLQLQVAFTF